MTVGMRHLSREEWRGRDRRVVACLRPIQDELTARYCLAWRQDCDDLDINEHVVLELASGNVFALLRYPRSPVPQIEVIVDLADGTASALLDEVLTALGLSRDDVSWTAQ